MSCTGHGLPSLARNLPSADEQVNDIISHVRQEFGKDISDLSNEMVESQFRGALSFTFFGYGRFRNKCGFGYYNCVLMTEKTVRLFLLPETLTQEHVEQLFKTNKAQWA